MQGVIRHTLAMRVRGCAIKINGFAAERRNEGERDRPDQVHPRPRGRDGNAQPVTIVYDSDGGILRFLGEDPNSILGFALGLCPTSDGINNTYNRGFALINGGASGVTTTELKTVMIHEFGHMLGLDHTQINLDCLNNPSACTTDGSIAGVPIMFPVLVDDKTSIQNRDDIAGISALYPVTGSPPGGTRQTRSGR